MVQFSFHVSLLAHIFITFVFLEFNLLKCNCSTGIDIYVNHKYIRTFDNASRGLDRTVSYTVYGDGHNCVSQNSSNPLNQRNVKKMDFTPNRKLQNNTKEDAQSNLIQFGIVLALGGHTNTHYDYGPYGSLNGLMAVWDSWVQNFFSVTSNSTSLILLFDERDYLRLNVSDSIDGYLDTILIKNMGAIPVDCVHHRRKTTSTTHQKTNHDKQYQKLQSQGRCSNELHLDQKYKVYYMNVSSIQNLSSSQAYQKPFMIFASVYKFPKPAWAETMDEEYLYTHWRPARMGKFKTNYGYVKLTNWYAYHMLNLKMLDFFDYAGKLDNDVSFVSPFPEPNLPMRLISKGAKMLATQKEWYLDSPRVSQGIKSCLNAFVKAENKLCAKTFPQYKHVELEPSGYQGHEIFWEGNMNATFRAHFLVFWLGLYSSPEVKVLAKFWNDWHPHGMWDYRWGDQQWWPRPMAMFSEGTALTDIDRYDEIDTENEKYVVHKDWPLFGTLMKTNYFHVNGSSKNDRMKLYYEAAKAFKVKIRPYQ